MTKRILLTFAVAGLLAGGVIVFQQHFVAQAAKITIPPVETEALQTYPTVTFDSAKVPNIVAHIKAAWVAGKPKTLTRITDTTKINANRTAACKNFTGTGSCDEYPFASTAEGGTGAHVAGVPLAEQNSQGGTLSAFYTANNIVDGSKFTVAVK